MITQDDNDYKETKAILNGEKIASINIAKLKVWIEEQFETKVLHIVQDYLENPKNPRLNVVLEKNEDIDAFYDESMNYDSLKQSMISNKYSELNGKNIEARSLLTKLFGKQRDEYFVCFSAYNPIAKSEIISNIPEEIKSSFRKRNKTEKVWQIHDSFLGAIVFLYKDEDIEKYRNSDKIEKLKDEFYNMVKPYDKNGLFKRDNLNFGIDSKENFDNNYKSNWYYYYK
jgi:hypothetical protein